MNIDSYSDPFMSCEIVSGMVSVVVPAYNRRNYIAQAIDSVLAQSYDNFEIIVVDDGSTDGTFEILDDYFNAGKIKLFFHEKRANKGQSASINLGLKAVRGEFVAILDSDDYWDFNKLDIQVEFLNSNMDVGLIYSNGYAVNESGDKLYSIHSSDHVEPCDPNSVLLDCYLALPVNSLVRRSVYDKVGGFDETFRAAQDHDMLIRMAEVTQFAYIPDFLWYYRKHGDSISVKKRELRWITGFEILRRAKARYPYRPETIRKRAAVLNFRLGQTYWDEGRKLKAIPYLVKSGLLDPGRALAVLSGKEKVR